MPSVTFKLLKLFSELYPIWVKSMNKDQSQKKLICTAYKKIIETKEVTEAQLADLENWLKSVNNQEYNKWPPQPLELVRILPNIAKSKVDHLVTTEDLSTNDFDPDLSIPRLVSLSILPLYKEKLFNDKNKHLQQYVNNAIDCYLNKKKIYRAAIKLDEIYRRHSNLYKNLSGNCILEKILSEEKRTQLLAALEIDNSSIPDILDFFKKTHFNSVIQSYVETLSDEN